MRPKLALSLNASNDAVREQIMPITRKWNIATLLEAVKAIPLRKREWVTFEYVLLGGVNDQPEHAREVLALLSGMRAKVNLIVWNPGPGIEYHQPKPEDVAVFQKMLIEGGMPTLYSAAAGAGYLCGLWAVEADGDGAGVGGDWWRLEVEDDAAADGDDGVVEVGALRDASVADFDGA